MNRVGQSLSRKLGPLPVWAWAIIAGVGLYVYRNRTSGGLFGGSSTTGTPAGSVAGAPAGAGGFLANPPAGRRPRPKRRRPPKAHRPPKRRPPAPAKPKRRQLIPGRKPHPHARSGHRTPATSNPVRLRLAGMKAGLAARERPEPSRLVQANAPRTPSHETPAVRLPFHAARTLGGHRPAEHYAPDLARTAALAPVAPARPPRIAAPAEQAPARRSHTDAPAHATLGGPMRARVQRPAAPTTAPPAKAKRTAGRKR